MSGVPQPSAPGGEPHSSGRVLVFDGDCAICRAAVRALERARLVGGARLRALDSFEGAQAERLREAGVHNEMAAFDPRGGPVATGVDALASVLEPRWARVLARVALGPPLAPLTRAAYRTVSYNRRILAPLPSGTRPRCACEPDFHLGYRLLFIALGVAFAVAATLLAGLGFDLRPGSTPPAQRALDFLAGAGSGWVLLILLATCLGWRAWLEWFAHLAVTMAVGLAVLAPAALAPLALGGAPLVLVQACFVLASFATMLRSQHRRLALQGRSRRWLLAWILCLALAPFASLWAIGVLPWEA